MSTEHQQYSTENQRDAIAQYAKAHVMEIVRTYADEGRSGLTLQRRGGLGQLLQDVESGMPGFSAILVYDVSRWGRFQDADESAYYEYRCKRAKINVHYCAEPFANDGSISSALLKSLKRTMAGEFSRELSAKVFAGKCRLIELGFRQGGRAGYGLRRLLVDRDGNPKGVLNCGEYKNLSTDRVILVPGPAEEVRIVREIYRRYIEHHESMPAITDALNRRGIVGEDGGPWTRDTVSGVLTNPKYVGTNVSNRRSFKLSAKTVHNPPEMWVRREGAFQPVVSADTFKKAAEVLAAHNRRHTDDELLDLLKGLLSRAGKLSGRTIDNAGGMPKMKTYRDRFGGLLGAYRRIGYAPPQDFSFLAVAKAIQASHSKRITALITELESVGATVRRDSATDLLTINDEFNVQFLAVRCCRNGKLAYRWFFRFDSSLPWDITVAARMNPQNDAVLDYYLVPRSEKLRDQSYSGASTSVLNIYRFDDLSVLKALVRRTRLKEEA